MERARISQVLDYFAEPYLVAWKLKNKDWQKVSQESLEIGSLIDLNVQKDINGEINNLVFTNPAADKCWGAWLKFKKARPDVLDRLIQYRHNMQRELVLGDLVGHPDFILDDEVIDLKTSKQVSKSHWMQTAQYAKMAFVTPITQCHPTKISILRLDKLTGDYEYKTLEEPFISFWQRKFQCRYEAYREDEEFSNMMRTKGEEALLNEL